MGKAKVYTISGNSEQSATTQGRQDQPPGVALERSTSHAPRHREMTARQMLHLVHRLTILIAAMSYFSACAKGSYAMVKVLRGNQNPASNSSPYNSPLIRQQLGLSTIANSLLVLQTLHNDTTPRSGTIFVDAVGASFDVCASAALLPGVYSRAFQREVFDAIIAGASYNISSLSELQLVAPAVDCNNTSIVTGDSTAIRFQFLARKRQSVTEVMLLTLSISNQQYTIPSQKERGSAGVATLTIIDDLRSNVVDHHFLVSIGYPFEPLNFRVYDFVNVTTDGFWTLQRIPEDSDSDLPKLLQTSCRTGFYIKSDTEQVNVKNEVWELSQSPIDAVTTWQWRGIPVLRDSWAWSHVFQFFQALDAISNLFVLILVFYRNIKVGRVWVGDAFVAVSTRIQFRGLMVLASWYINEFWALMELCYHDANAMSAFDDTFIQSDIIRADVLAIFLSGAGWLGVMTKDRIDPGIAVLVFHIGFENRLTIINWFPSVQAVMVAEAAKLNSASILSFSMDDRASPMHLWGIHPLGERSIKLILAVLTPMLFIFTFIIVYVIARKIYRRLVPEHVHQVHRMTGVSEDEEVLLARQSVLTLFELATGAALQNRFGLVSDYENCLYIKGQKYASADGIYSNGFIIANKKYLVQLDDVRALLLMKVLQVRYRNVYAFEVEGNAVHQTARLMYPNTMTLHDLVHLNISILS